MNVVITGASKGFGNVLAEEALKRNYKVTSLSRTPPPQKEIKHIYFDLKSFKELPEIDCDIFIHSAWIYYGGTPFKKWNFEKFEESVHDLILSSLYLFDKINASKKVFISSIGITKGSKSWHWYELFKSFLSEIFSSRKDTIVFYLGAVDTGYSLKYSKFRKTKLRNSRKIASLLFDIIEKESFGEFWHFYKSQISNIDDDKDEIIKVDTSLRFAREIWREGFGPYPISYIYLPKLNFLDDNKIAITVEFNKMFNCIFGKNHEYSVPSTLLIELLQKALITNERRKNSIALDELYVIHKIQTISKSDIPFNTPIVFSYKVKKKLKFLFFEFKSDSLDGKLIFVKKGMDKQTLEIIKWKQKLYEEEFL